MEYMGRRAKCSKCREPFVLQRYNPEQLTQPNPICTKLPFSAPKCTEESQTNEDSNPNIIEKSWLKSPAPFRNAFIATLGVVTALVLCYYGFTGIPKLWTNRTISDLPPSLPVVTNPISGVERQPDIIGTQSDMSEKQVQMIGSALLLSQKAGRLTAIQDVRIMAVKLCEKDTVSFMHSIENTQMLLNSLYEDIRTSSIFQQKEFINAHSLLLNTVKAESDFQDALLQLCKIGDIEIKAARVKKTGETVHNSTVLLYGKIAELFLKIDVRVLQVYLGNY